MKTVVNKKRTAVKCPGCKAINRVDLDDVFDDEWPEFTCKECWTTYTLCPYKEEKNG